MDDAQSLAQINRIGRSLQVVDERRAEWAKRLQGIRAHLTGRAQYLRNYGTGPKPAVRDSSDDHVWFEFESGPIASKRIEHGALLKFHQADNGQVQVLYVPSQVVAKGTIATREGETLGVHEPADFTVDILDDYASRFLTRAADDHWSFRKLPGAGSKQDLIGF